jgi:hypothetical protein
MKKITLIIPTGYDDLLTISCIGHYRNHSVTNVATRAFDITAEAETTIDLTEDIRAVERIKEEDKNNENNQT